MIFNGLTGWVRGDLSVPTNTVLAMTVGPVKGRNWIATTHNPAYSISITAGATGTVALQGTNDIAVVSSADEPNAVQMDVLPSETAVWTDLQTATSVSATGTFTTEWEFLRLIVTASGTGTVTQAWVRWH